MTTKKSLAQTLIVIASLIGAVTLLELFGAIKYVYLGVYFGENFYTFYLTFLCFFFALIFYLIFILVRLVQLRLIEVVALLLIPFLFLAGLASISEWNYRAAWKFRVNKAEYLSVLAADSSPSPKYHVFDWGNRGGGFGSSVFYEAIVYDETDEIARDPASRSPEWIARTSNPLPRERWITEPVQYPCKRSPTESFGEHFYFVEKIC